VAPVQNDVLKEYVARGTYIYPPAPSLRLVTDVFEFASREVPQWNTISVSGYHMREAGCTAVQELAFTLANGLTYLEAARARGLDVTQIARRISFFFNAHNHLFEEAAKFRAGRKLWAELLRERFGVRDADALKLRVHAQTAGSMLTAQQPLNNVVRVTVQALGAVLGGTQSLHTNSYDEALGLPSEASALLALRTQQVLAHESGAADAADPLAGSYWVERLTADIEAGARALIERIDRSGGMLASIESGWVQQQIHEAAYRWQREVESGDRVVVGVNRFAQDDPPTAPPFRPDPAVERARAAYLASWRAERERRRCARRSPSSSGRTRLRVAHAADPRCAPPPRHARRGVRHDARRIRRVRAGRTARVSERPDQVAGGAAAPVGLSHVAIAVRDADALAATLVAALGARRGEEELLDGGRAARPVRAPRPRDDRAARATLRRAHGRALPRHARRRAPSREPRGGRHRRRAGALPRGRRATRRRAAAGGCARNAGGVPASEESRRYARRAVSDPHITLIDPRAAHRLQHASRRRLEHLRPGRDRHRARALPARAVFAGRAAWRLDRRRGRDRCRAGAVPCRSPVRPRHHGRAYRRRAPRARARRRANPFRLAKSVARHGASSGWRRSAAPAAPSRFAWTWAASAAPPWPTTGRLSPGSPPRGPARQFRLGVVTLDRSSGMAMPESAAGTST
jgi:hypothetical protein